MSDIGTSTTQPRHADEDALVAFLSDRDVACPLCGYNLRGLRHARCPECGRELQLTVGLTEPYLRAWIALAVGVFASAGIGLLFLLLVPNLGWPWLQGIGNAALLYFLFSPVLLLPTLRGRRRFLRIPKSRQWLIAGLALAATVAAMIVMAVMLR